jgi:chromosomal replication initiator protein
MSSAVELSKCWSDVHIDLKKAVGDAIYNSWILPLSLHSIESGIITVQAPNKFMCDWVSNHYGSTIHHIIAQSIPDVRKVVFIPDQKQSECSSAVNDSQDASSKQHSLSRQNTSQIDNRPPLSQRKNGRQGNGQLAGAIEFSKKSTPISASNGKLSGRLETIAGTSLDPRYTFDTFIVGKPNELGYAAARRVADAGKSAAFNPLFLYGSVGLGKTHLMQAIAWNLKETHPECRVIYISAEQFMYEFVRSIRFKDTFSFKELFRSVDVLMIDDVQFIAGKDSTQEEFFHTFNALVDQNRQIVISADRSPSDLEGVEERLRSRLGWGLVIDIYPTDYELRLGILQSKAEILRAERPNLVLNPGTLEFLAHRIVSNVRVLEGALNRLTAYSSLTGKDISTEVAQQELQDILRSSDRKITIEEIQKKVARHFNVRHTDMISTCRARNIARPRQIAMYLTKELTTRSLPEIGKKFGGRDHTTVLHAVKKIATMREQDSTIFEDIEMLRRELES